LNWILDNPIVHVFVGGGIAMGRWVIPRRVRRGADFAAGATEAPDRLVGRLIKYIPTELLTLYAATYGAMATFQIEARTAQWVVVATASVFFAACIAWLAKRAPGGVVRRAHMIVGPFAFLAWAYSISSGLLRDWFFGPASVLSQAVVLLLAWVVEPVEEAAQANRTPG
jgi:hypothetical protein